VADKISPATGPDHANDKQQVLIQQQVLIMLRFLASGSFQQVIGDTVAGFNR
jgi:hypothetical protein